MSKSLKICCRKSGILFSLIFSLLFISCFNSLTPNPDSSTGSAQGSNTALNISSDRYVDISGHYSLDGALPKEIAASMYPQEQAAFSRSSGISYSALPLVGTTHNVVEYYAIATDANGVESPVSGTVTVADRSFQISHLKIGVSWIVEVGIKVKNTVNGTDVWVRCLYDISEPQTFTETDFTFNKTFLLKPDTSGTGSINLEMTVDSSITDFTVSLDDSEKEALWETAFDNDTNSTKEITGSQAKIKFAGLPAGVYEVTLKFYKTSVSTGYPVFSTVQTINVISGMTTENWASDGTSLFTGSGTATVFNLTSTLINEYEKSLIYVGQTSVATSALDTNEGTAYAPLATLQEAINRIESNNNPKDYRIFVSGTVSGAPTGDAEINSSINGKALSITIDKTGNTNDAAPVINGSGNNSVLYIETEVPVKIRNVTITGGNTISSGGGISIIDSNTKVTLEGNVVITENHTSVSGGGIYNEGELIIKNATITENTSAEHGAGIYNAGDLVIYNGEISLNSVNGSAAYKYGGGIYNSSSCKIKGGTITLNNSTSHGGGIFNTNTGHLELSGGTISANALPNANDADDNGGAGIYSSGTFDFSGGTITGHTYTVNGSSVIYTGCVEIRGGTFTMTGGLISGNRSRGYTAGVYISSIPSTISISGGTISDNVTFSTASNKGGAIYCDGDIKLSGTVYIPEGDNNGTTGKGYNDIYLSAGKKIIAAGNLSKHLETGASPLAITVTNWTRGNTVIEADGTGITDLSSYFNFVSSKTIDWDTELSGDKTKIFLNSPIYVAGSTDHPTCGVAGSSSGNGSSSAPFNSIANACSIMDNASLDYKIYIDGTIPAGQSVGTSVNGKAKSITITGANAVTVSNGRRIPADKIYGTSPESGSPGFIVDTSDGVNQPVLITLTNLLITNCFSASKAAGISLASGTLTLGDDLVITGNKAGSVGAGSGVYCKNDGVTFNIRGNVKIDGNTDASATPNPCNVYLGNNRIINVTGPLNKKDENGDILENAKIYVSMENTPDLTNSYRFTSGFNTNNPDIIPGTYFHGDKWAVRAVASGETYAGEAELAASGGSISIDPIYEDITISVDKFLILKSDTSKAFSFSAKGKNANGTNKTLTIGNGEGKVHLTYSLSYHGEDVPSEEQYYTTGTNTFTLGSSLPAGDYTLSAKAEYNGKTYSVSFPVQFKEFLGSKSKTQERAVGDIIFNDGSAMPYSEYAALDDSIKNSGLKKKAIAVIYYKGTDLNNDGDTTTVRTLGVGLKQWGECFCNAMAKAFNEKITTIQCGVSGSAWNYNFTGDKKGSDNLDQIAAFFEANNITEPNFSSYYSAFNRASNYQGGILTSENSSRISWDSEYATGWYFPTIAELFWIYKNCKIEGESKVFDIDTVMEALGGDKFESNTYLSSSQHSSTAKNIYTLTSYNISSLEKNDGRKKTCYIREF